MNIMLDFFVPCCEVEFNDVVNTYQFNHSALTLLSDLIHFLIITS